jgi:aminopeptidase N
MMNLQQALDQLRYGSLETRLRAIKRLEQLVEPASLLPLIETLDDLEQEVRAEAAKALVLFADQQPVPKLVKLLQDHYWQVRANAASTLGQLGDKAACPALRQLVEKNWRSSLLYEYQHQALVKAVIALGQLKDQCATPLLIKILKKGYRGTTSDLSLELRRAAAHSLGQLENAQALEALFELLHEGECQEMREIALCTISHFKNEASFKKLLRAVKRHFPEEPHQIWLRQKAAALALGKMRKVEVVPHLLPLADNPSPEVRIALAQALGELGEKSSSQAVLLRLTRDRVDQVRLAAVRAIRQLGLEGVSRELEAIRADPNPQVVAEVESFLKRNLQGLD